jgi:hypothetical protein
LRALYGYLVQHGSITANPWKGVAMPSVSHGHGHGHGHGGIDSADLPRIVDQGAVEGVGQGSRRAGIGLDAPARALLAMQMQRLAPTGTNARLRLAIGLLQDSGAGIDRLVSLTIADLQAPTARGQQWRLQIAPGRHVALSARTLAQLQATFSARGLAPALQAADNRGAHLLGRAADAAQRAPWAPCAQGLRDAHVGIAAGTLRDQVRALFQDCARVAKCPELQHRFNTARSRMLGVLPR